MRKIEVLAPAGSFEALEAGIQNGADAVYLSGEFFGARKHATNFANEELKRAVEYAHIRNVSVYVTVNILIKEVEFNFLKEYLDFLYTSDVDAVIVQDLGVARYIKTNYSDFEIHASTQMSAHSYDDVKFLSDFGFKRVVVAREMSISEISKIVKNIDIEVEVFVHGALCISYSGQCLMSSMIGGRSGNRGRCAQPCRQKYELSGSEDKAYLMSPRDLSTLDEVHRLINMGVTSLKIEGRMKKPEYAAVIVNSYKKVVDAYNNDELKDFDYKTEAGRQKSMFNRSFTEGFVFDSKKIIASESPGNRGVRIGTVSSYNPKEEKLFIRLEKRLHKGDEIQIRRGTESVGARTDVFYLEGKRVNKYNVYDIISVDFKYNAKVGEVIYRTYDNEIMKEAKQSYLKEYRKSKITMNLTIKLDQQIELILIDDLNNTVTVSSENKVEKAINRPIEEDRVKKQLVKLGDSSYEASIVNIVLDEGVSLPISEINVLRRTAIEKLNELRKIRYNRNSKLEEIKEYPDKYSYKGSYQSKELKIIVSVRTLSQLKAVIDAGAEEIYYGDINTLEEAFKLYGKEKIIPRLFRITPKDEISKIKIILDSLLEKGSKLVVGSLGQVNVFNEYDLIIDTSLNVFNQGCVDEFVDRNIKRIALSYEMSKNDMKMLSHYDDVELEMTVYGYTPVMVTKYCPIIKANTNCENCSEKCKDHYVLKDKMDAEFALIRSSNFIEVLNSKRLYLLEKAHEIKEAGIDVVRLDFTIETDEEINKIFEVYEDVYSGAVNYYDIESLDIIKKIEEEGYTYGHLFRTIE